MEDKRFSDSGETIYDFMNNILVVCPQCGKCAYGFINPAKIICHQCGYTKTYNRYGVGAGTFCGAALWLRTPVCGETLWAYNQEHLDFIENYVRATIRTRTPNINQSLASRLPAWIKKGGNREAILKGIQILKEKAE